MMERDLNKQVSQATKWSSITEIASKLVAPVTNMILARLLVPEAFGVVATLTMVVSFAEIFTDAGFQKYIVQHDFADEADLEKSTNVAFWTNLILSLAIWGLIALFATPIATLVGSPNCTTAIIIMSMEIPLLAFSSIQMARYRRDFDFKGLFVARITTSLVPLVITVPLAFLFKSYWALVIGTLAKDVLNAIILTAKSRWKPRIFFSIQKLKEMLSFSLWTVVENVSIWLTNYIGTFVVGIALSEYYLGLYKTTMSTANSYMNLITAATTPVLFSALSRCQDDDSAFNEVFFRFQRMVAVLVLPIGFGICVFRELATTILLGNQWMETADFMGIWCLTSALTMIFSHYNSEVFRSKGKPKLSVLTQVLHLIVLVPVLIWGSGKGYAVLTTARSWARLEIILVSSIIMQAVFRIRFVDTIKNVWPALMASVCMALAGAGLRLLLDGVVWECVCVVICVIVYAVCMLMIPSGRKQLAEIPVLQKAFHLSKEPVNEEDR